MEHKKNGYATNKGGLIKAPQSPAAGDPKGTSTIAGGAGDLRVKRAK